MVITLSENNNNYQDQEIANGIITLQYAPVGDIMGELYLYPSWHQVVCSSEDELLSVVAVW